ncbi:MAG: DUF2284 domain-containing protein, partial [Candidatus Thorarchaeota archaeon]
MSDSSSLRKGVEDIFQKHGVSDFKWIKPNEIVVVNWVRMKCMYSCPNYGKGACCPPNVPSVKECGELIDEYSDIVVIHFELKVTNPETRHEEMKEFDLKMLEIEREVFLSGLVKAFLLAADNCLLCGDCVSDRVDCKQP